MKTEIANDISDNTSILKIWGILISLCCVITATFYVIIGLFLYRKLMAEKVGLLILIPVFALIGALHAFFYLGAMCIAIGCILNVFGRGVGILHAAVFSSIMSFVIISLAMGRKTQLYAF
ncbi:unnamed protein product [Phytomonas sp. Hart1]|nr:unnamed protein product [Phytomonas sp. Hart1]|eukprot:CCW67133.1 unnamed protein product [Phytomonas sp. isolate Hart1]